MQNQVQSPEEQLKQNKEQNKLKLCWTVYSNQISIASLWSSSSSNDDKLKFLRRLRRLYVPRLSPSLVLDSIAACLDLGSFPGYVPFPVPIFVPISDPSLRSLHSFTSSAPVTTLIHLGFLFVLSVYVILSRFTGVCCSKKQQNCSVKTMQNRSCGLRGCMKRHARHCGCIMDYCR